MLIIELIIFKYFRSFTYVFYSISSQTQYLKYIIQSYFNSPDLWQGPLPIDPQLLGERAMHCRAYAKALHYKEEEFHKARTSQVLESLISINNKLQQKEAAAGNLNLTNSNYFFGGKGESMTNNLLFHEYLWLNIFLSSLTTCLADIVQAWWSM